MVSEKSSLRVTLLFMTFNTVSVTEQTARVTLELWGALDGYFSVQAMNWRLDFLDLGRVGCCFAWLEINGGRFKKSEILISLRWLSHSSILTVSESSAGDFSNPHRRWRHFFICLFYTLLLAF